MLLQQPCIRLMSAVINRKKEIKVWNQCLWDACRIWSYHDLRMSRTAVIFFFFLFFLFAVAVVKVMRHNIAWIGNGLWMFFCFFSLPFAIFKWQGILFLSKKKKKKSTFVKLSVRPSIQNALSTICFQCCVMLCTRCVSRGARLNFNSFFPAMLSVASLSFTCFLQVSTAQASSFWDGVFSQHRSNPFPTPYSVDFPLADMLGLYFWDQYL